jgi:hypothetical protein
VRQSIVVAFLVLLGLPTIGVAIAEEDRCSTRFPDVEWATIDVDAPVTVATAGMRPEMAVRFAADVERVASQVDSEIGGLDEVAVCLATPEITLDVGDLVAPGQRLHVAAFGEEKLLALSAVEIRFVDDAIAFGLPHIALYQVAQEVGIDGAYPEPLASTIGHWYLARANGRLERNHTELVVGLFLDDPNPDQRTDAEATSWVATPGEDPFVFDPQFVASPMGDFVDYATRTYGFAIVRDPVQETWGPLEKEWRVAMRDELLEGRQGSYGAEWGVAVVVVFIILAILLALQQHRRKKRAAERLPTPPADESLFESSSS